MSAKDWMYIILGTMPVFMLAEPFILLGAIAGFVISVIKARKSGN